MADGTGLKPADAPWHDGEGEWPRVGANSSGRCDGQKVTNPRHPDVMDLPGHSWRPRPIVVDSMPDLFHQSLPDGMLILGRSIMAQRPERRFLILTGHAEEIKAFPDRVADASGNGVDPDATVVAAARSGCPVLCRPDGRRSLPLSTKAVVRQFDGQIYDGALAA